MLKKYFFIIGVLISTFQVQAQFIDDMESYTDGEPISENHWTEWDCEVGAGCNIMATSDKVFDLNLSGWIPGDGTTKAVLDLGNKIFGDWRFYFMVYIPSGKEAVFSLQGEVPIDNGQSIVGDFLFNPNLETPGVGKITDSALGEVSFNFPHGEWFLIHMNIDISAGINLATWQFIVDGVEVIYAGTSFTNENGDNPTSLGGILFSSNSVNTSMYVDRFEFSDFIINVEDQQNFRFKLYPNPVKNRMHINTQESINNISIYNLQGSLIKNTSQTTSIDVSKLASGMYFIEVRTDSGKSVQKFIKK